MPDFATRPLKAMAAALLLVARVTSASTQSSSDEDWLFEGLAAQIPKYVQVTFRPHPANSGLVAANCESGISWWGTLRVFHRTGDEVDWIALLPEEFTGGFGHYILSCEWRFLKALDRWVLEVFDSTHRGNGSLWLLALEDGELRVLLHEEAAGQVFDPDTLRRHGVRKPFEGEVRYLERHLKATYPTRRNSQRQAIVLSGTLVSFDQNDRRVARKAFTERWIWNASAERFEPAQR